ncbi:GDSL-type esterase/lipase family protein [Selenomonas sp. GACV-9]|uniref:SGNH/GDSL hydrolase family protein n=1 Tax=Selenomonas sp. GACV-9 TaxID=3158782 RepID=UPI00094C7335
MKIKVKNKWLLAGTLCLAAGLLAGAEPVSAATTATSARTVRTAANTSRVIALGQNAKMADTAAKTAARQPAATNIHNVRLTWKEQPSAVQYQVVILRSEQDDPSNIAVTQEQIFTNGVDINLSRFGSAAGNFYWKVCALDYNGRAIGHFSKPRPLTDGGEINPRAPKPTTQFADMDYAPVYPVYSWVPLAGAKHHEVSVYRVVSWGNSLVHTLSAGEYDVYEEGGFTTPGKYFWQVRSVDAAGNPTSEWSEKVYFDVTGPTPIAALGDSITHGGGAMSVPPGYLLYDWESYASVPVKNIGYSGNTTADMLERFERDILPFSPRVLVIMGGVNDYRGTVNGWTTVQNLAAMRDKCDAYGIIPVFLTATPINPTLMVKRAHIDAPPADWQVHMQYVNDWVMQQRYCVDVSTMLADSNGWLRANYTTDGLHPDYYGKKYIGERVGEYLNAHFAWITKKLTKKPIPQYEK